MASGAGSDDTPGAAAPGTAAAGVHGCTTTSTSSSSIALGAASMIGTGREETADRRLTQEMLEAAKRQRLVIGEASKRTNEALQTALECKHPIQLMQTKGSVPGYVADKKRLTIAPGLSVYEFTLGA
jgi:hypothetical protein